MTPQERELLIEQVVSAHRERDAFGRVRAAPGWFDLDEAGRRDAFEETVRARALEAAADPRRLSGTAKAVLARIQQAR